MVLWSLIILKWRVLSGIVLKTEWVLLEELLWVLTSPHSKQFEGLDIITKPFKKEEMDNVVKHMLVDKAPGPDGFNGLFFKKCWHIISKDFYELAWAFYDGTAALENINGSYITLVPKRLPPEEVGDFRPISLTGMGLKFLSKMAASRFQDVIMECIHKNQ